MAINRLVDITAVCAPRTIVPTSYFISPRDDPQISDSETLVLSRKLASGGRDVADDAIASIAAHQPDFIGHQPTTGVMLPTVGPYYSEGNSANNFYSVVILSCSVMTSF